MLSCIGVTLMQLQDDKDARKLLEALQSKLMKARDMSEV